MTQLELLAIEFVKAKDNHIQAQEDYVAYHSKRPKFNHDKVKALENGMQDTGHAEMLAYTTLSDYVHGITAVSHKEGDRERARTKGE